MSPHYTYLFIDAGILILPFLLSLKGKPVFYQRWKVLTIVTLISAAVFIIWDIIFVHQGVWWFSREHTLPFRLAGLPIEEYLFYLIIPFTAVVIYTALSIWFPLQVEDTARPLTNILSLTLLLLGLLNYSRAYTLAACLASGAPLLLVNVLRAHNPHFRTDRFILTYSILLLPFLAAQAILTSTPVFFYDDSENIGIRLFTVPIEAPIQGLLLVLLPVWLITYTTVNTPIFKNSKRLPTA